MRIDKRNNSDKLRSKGMFKKKKNVFSITKVEVLNNKFFINKKFIIFDI